MISDASALHALFAAEWDHEMEQSPTWASQLGDRRWNGRWDDVGLDAWERRDAHRRDLLRRMDAFDSDALAPDDRLHHDLFRREVGMAVEEHRHRAFLAPVTQLNGIQLADDLADALRFETAGDFEDWVERLRAFPAWMDQTVGLMREGLRARIVQPRFAMQRVPRQIAKQIVDDPAESPFFRPFRVFPDAVPGPERDRLRREASDAIRDGVVPAFRRFHAFFTSEYLPGCFDAPGVWQSPGGEAWYAFCVRKFTTTDLTPQEVHAIGLEAIRSIRAEMEAVLGRVGFRGSLAAFFRHLQEEPRFRYQTAEELLTDCRARAKRIDPVLVKAFRTLPRMPYGVEAVPAAAAPDTTGAYYREPAADGSRAGTFFVNLHRPESRLRHEMTALALHESVPGHHLQIALAMEREGLPAFRRYRGATAFIEGWALYAERLGRELGLYEDDFAEFGRLSYDMWRAVRLVVDTGLHALRWDRARAVDCFRESAGSADHEIQNEVDRYAVWPGQALAYKVGEMRIRELRARAERELGPRFDLRDFHDAILREGALPLDVLGRVVDGWIRGRRS
jgi:uncharacterized protein (DUF885 family)